MKESTATNIHIVFVGEANARHQRLLLYAQKAEKEGLPQIAPLFRAVSQV